MDEARSATVFFCKPERVTVAELQRRQLYERPVPRVADPVTPPVRPPDCPHPLCPLRQELLDWRQEAGDWKSLYATAQARLAALQAQVDALQAQLRQREQQGVARESPAAATAAVAGPELPVDAPPTTLTPGVAPMTAPDRLDVIHHFARAQDPRDPRYSTYALGDILIIALCAMLSGAKGFQDMVEFGRVKEPWLRTLGLTFPEGIPSHDTFRDIFRRLNPAVFQDCFLSWVNAAWAKLGFVNVQIDGKALRGSRGLSGTCLYLVSAWMSANSLTLAQVAVGDKSNEITAIPKLLQMLELGGALVTIDAMGCQKEIAQAVRASGADYLLQVKGNQPTLEADINASFDAAFAADFKGYDHDVWASESHGHGRDEERVCVVLRDLGLMSTKDEWKDLKSIVRVTRTRKVGDKESSVDVAHYISSSKGGAEELGRSSREHWGIENGLHWVLDVTFREDDCRLKDRIAAENLGLLRRIAVSLLRRDKSKGSVCGKVRRAAWDDNFRLDLLKNLSELSP